MLDKVTTPGIAQKIREYYGDDAEKIIENLEIEVSKAASSGIRSGATGN